MLFENIVVFSTEISDEGFKLLHECTDGNTSRNGYVILYSLANMKACHRNAAETKELTLIRL